MLSFREVLVYLIMIETLLIAEFRASDVWWLMITTR